ncbi:MAG TPA: hypothetical protein VE961_13430 [Pyrinomonadaceae bacterium]|nr:hypothetical protein [Pyrinomonadaceae bacterium]
MLRKIHLVLLVTLVSVVVQMANSPAMAQHPQETLEARTKKANGKLIWRYRPNRSVVYPTLEELAKRSDIIVIGRALAHRTTLRADGKFVTEDFSVRAQEVIKGDVTLAGNRSIIVSLPGGVYTFPDGAYVSVRAVGWQSAEDKGLYVFFLRKKNKNSPYKGFQLASETQGLFALKDGMVQPASLVGTDPLVVKHKGTDAAAFLKEVHKAAPQKKSKK